MNHFRLQYSFFLLLCFSVCLNLVLADSNENQKEMEALQEEIAKYEQELSQKRAKEQSTANLIASLDRKIDMTSGMLYNLRQEVKQLDAQIRSSSDEIAQLEEHISRLRELIKKRLVSFYKYGRRRDYEMLFIDGSWSRANIWLKYQKLVAQNDRRNFGSLVTKVEKLRAEEQQLRQDVAKKERLLEEQQQKTAQLKSSRSKRRQYLTTIQEDRAYVEQHLQELQAAQKEIRGFIASSEKERAEKQRQISHKKEQIIQQPTRDYSFASLRGRLPWPTAGKVISHFGKERHPTLKTVTENLGIEIRAPLGTPVKSVDGGQVQTITWQRGRGNIIIISHDDGYYTVYTHLADIRVNTMDYIESGQVIGTVGDSGSLHGPVLHFQIWKNTENLDPEDWLG